MADTPSRPTLADVITIGTGAAAFCYASGWVFYFSAFRQLRLAPEDVGVGFDFLAIRFSLLLSSMCVIVGLILAITGVAGALLRRQPSDKRTVETAVLTSAVVLFSLSIVAAYIVGRVAQPHLNRVLVMAVAVALGSAATAATGGAAM